MGRPKSLVKSECSIDGCSRKVVGYGWCSKHYSRWRRNGDPLALRVPGRTMTTEDRFWCKVDKAAGCWLWTSTLDPTGYGRFNIAGRMVRAHRYSYELVKGPIPDGLVLDHLCRRRSCVNPDHLEPVTLRENIQRGYAARRRDHCPQGHEWTPENTYLYGKKRWCRACRSKRESGRRAS